MAGQKMPGPLSHCLEKSHSGTSPMHIRCKRGTKLGCCKPKTWDIYFNATWIRGVIIYT